MSKVTVGGAHLSGGTSTGGGGLVVLTMSQAWGTMPRCQTAGGYKRG